VDSVIAGGVADFFQGVDYRGGIVEDGLPGDDAG